jgi:predicted porin
MWNPNLTLVASMERPTGTDYRSIGGGLTAGNVFRFSDDLRVPLSIGGTYTIYNERTSGVRSDLQIVADLGLTYTLNERFTAFLTAQYTLNNSTDSSYTYNRILGLVGASYNLF